MENLRGGLMNNGPRDEGKKLVIISETDLKGHILSANDPFCAVSGYSRDELIGSPHSIIRHPSMPKELFQQLWSTIQNGEVFRGIIKNRTKEGAHYWVNATIMPVFQGSKIVRYVGGRYLLNDDQLAEDLFKNQMSALLRG